MREIKFRIWDSKSRGMFETFGDWYIDHEYGTFSILMELTYTDRENLILMQYAGLKDCNGIEIYEGDIIETVDTNNNICRSIVKFHQGVFCVGAWSERPPKSVEHYNYDGDWRGQGVEIEDDEILYIVLQHSLNFKVVGNIYEHPHLLEETK